MPLVKRSVSPSDLCRQKIPANIKNELECVTNNTLSGVILQLSSLSVHAEDVFGELFTEANSFYSRATKLQDRIDNLSVKVTQLDSTVEEVSLHDINMRKAFRSSTTTDQQVVSRESLPKTLMTTYNRANKPPPLQELNKFRDDDRDALKIYTDPDYFFNLWRDAMQKEMRDAKEKRREQRKKERRANPNYRQGNKVKAAIPKSRLKAQQMQQGAEFMDSNKPEAHTQQTYVPSNDAGIQNSTSAPSMHQDHHAPPTANHMPPPPEPEPQSGPYDPYMATPPPPPPPPTDNQVVMDHYAPPPSNTHLPAPPPPPSFPNGGLPDYPHDNDMIPPPPPPPSGVPPPPMVSSIPPPPMGGGMPPPPAPAPVSGLAGALQGISLKKSEPAPPPPVDERSNLLSAIRVGINLKKVEQQEQTAAAATSSGKNDVASILARRIAVEFSDSEDDSFDEDDGDWD